MAAAAALGRLDALSFHVGAALDLGCTPSEVRECLLVVSLFAGFPRTLDALASAGDVLSARGAPAPAAEQGLPADEAERRETFRRRGRALFDRVYGSKARSVMSRLMDLDPELPLWVLDDAYGKVLARPGLDPAQRERLAVVLLAALGLRNQLPGHVRGAVNCGATRDDVLASVEAAREFVDPADAALVEDTLRRVGE